jgi:hypothetical protein
LVAGVLFLVVLCLSLHDREQSAATVQTMTAKPEAPKPEATPVPSASFVPSAIPAPVDQRAENELNKLGFSMKQAHAVSYGVAKPAVKKEGNVQ